MPRLTTQELQQRAQAAALARREERAQLPETLRLPELSVHDIYALTHSPQVLTQSPRLQPIAELAMKAPSIQAGTTSVINMKCDDVFHDRVSKAL